MSNYDPVVKMLSTCDIATDEAKQIFEQMEKKFKKIPKWMRVMANSEDIFVNFFRLFSVIMDDKPINRLLKWKVAFKVSDINKCEFCVSVAKYQLKSFGLTDEEIEKMETEKMDEKEKIAIEYATQMTLHAYKIDQDLITRLKKHFTDEQIVELTSVVGLFNFINRFNDALRVLPDVS